MNIQQVEQAPAPITEPLFKFLLHFTGLNPDRGSDLQGKASHRACSALAQPVLAGFVYPGIELGEAEVLWNWAGHQMERKGTLPLKLSLMKDLSSTRNSTPCLPQERDCRDKKTI